MVPNMWAYFFLILCKLLQMDKLPMHPYLFLPLAFHKNRLDAPNFNDFESV